MDLITPLILCGGSCTRLWPLSHKSLPKQFVPLIGNKTPLQLTLESVSFLSKKVICVASDEEVLQTAPVAIDLIELRRANLAMSASVAEEGLPLTGQETLSWAHFLHRTWRDMEDFYWSKRHAALPVPS